MDDIDKNLEDLLNMTDSNDTSSSSDGDIFGNKELVVLDLHDLKKDESGRKEVVDLQEAKRNKCRGTIRKKPDRHVNQDDVSDTSSSPSDSIQNVPDEAFREEFYDAYESYHELPESKSRNPTTALVLARAHSEPKGNATGPKITPQSRSETPSSMPQIPSTLNKPVSNPP